MKFHWIQSTRASSSPSLITSAFFCVIVLSNTIWEARQAQAASTPPAMTDPRNAAGVWKRLWEEDPLGDDTPDRETLVCWMQTPCGIYVDLRQPPRMFHGMKLARHPQALAGGGYARSLLQNMPQLINDGTVLQQLLQQQKSFAGRLDVQVGDATDGTALQVDAALARLCRQGANAAIPLCTCTWHRHVDYQPPSDSLDVGVCCSDICSTDESSSSFVDLRETGQDGSYAEGWRRHHHTSVEPFMALELSDDDDGDKATRRGYWIRVGNQFAYAVGRKAALAQQLDPFRGSDLQEATQHLDSVERRLDVALDYVCCMGEIDGPTWRITACLHPQLVGCTLFSSAEDNGSCSHLRVVSQSQPTILGQVLLDGTVRQWKAVQLIDCQLPGHSL